MKKELKFKSGELVWIKKWDHRPIVPQVAIYLEGAGTLHFVFLTNFIEDMEGKRTWCFDNTEIRKATFKETEAYLKTIIQP